MSTLDQLPPEIDFEIPETLRGQAVTDVEATIPPNWIAAAVKGGLGKRDSDPERLGDQIRIMTGNPADPDPVKRGPYARISKSGKVSDPIPLAGNPTLQTGTP
jgi:hypothetical protein